MKKLSFSVDLALLFLFPIATFAANFAAGNQPTLRQGDIIRGNYYVAGGTVLIEGIVEGDLIVAGGDVAVHGHITKDIIVAGGSVDVSGEVDDDIRAAGGKLLVRGTVGGELVAAGGQVEVSSSASIGGDVTVAGGQLLLDGVTNGNVVARGGTVTISGKVLGNTTIDAGEVIVHRTAVLGSAFSYVSRQEATIAEGSSFAQPPVFTKRAGSNHEGRGALAAVIGGWWLLKLLMTLVVGYTLYYLFRPRIEALALDVHEHLASRVLHGLAALFVIPAVCILLMMTIVGIPLGIIGISLYAIMLVVASSTAGIAFGSVLDKYIWKRPDGMITWQSVGIGIILLKLIQLIPIAGWIIGLIFFAFTFGYYYDSFSRWLKSRNQLRQDDIQQTLLS